MRATRCKHVDPLFGMGNSMTAETGDPIETAAQFEAFMCLRIFAVQNGPLALLC